MQSLIDKPIVRDTSALVSVQNVHYVGPIPGKDLIIQGIVLGYSVVVKRSDFWQDSSPSTLAEARMCVFFEPDSLLDNSNPDFAFMARKKFRIRTEKMGGVMSQGLALPLSMLERYGIDATNLKEGDDLTAATKTTKYVAPEEWNQYEIPRAQHLKMGSNNVDPRIDVFPPTIPKTDEPNLQRYIFFLETLDKQQRKVTITQKYDGSSATFGKDIICSRNFRQVPMCEDCINALEKKDTEEKESSTTPLPELKPSECKKCKEEGTVHKNGAIYQAINLKYNILQKMEKYPNLVLQGEIIGPRVNGNRHSLKELDFYVFNVWDLDSHHYITFDKVKELCKELGLKHVPVLHYQVLMKELPFKTAQDWLSYADSLTYPENGKLGEGIVIKTDDGFGPRMSFKVVSPQYLAKM